MGYGVSGDHGPVVCEQTFRAQALRSLSQPVELSNINARLLQYAAQRTGSDLAVARHYRCAGYTALCPGKLDVASLLSNLREPRRAQLAYHVTVRIRLHLRWR